MTFRLRALRAVLLLAGFFLMGIGLLTAMAVLDWLLVTQMLTAQAARFEGAIIAVTVLLALVILRGMFTFLRAGRLGPVDNAVAVRPGDQPELWEEVRAAAEVARERPPDELYLVNEANAGVAEQSRLLGLLPGRRRIFLGLPLLAGLTVPRLRAVLAHEFGHYGHRDGRVGALAMRGRKSVLHTVEMFQEGSTSLHRAIGGLYVAYAHMFLRTSQSAARDQEFAADRTAAEHAGRDATTATLRALPVISAAHDHYMKAYAGMGDPMGALAPVGEVCGGFRRLVAARPGDRLAVLTAGTRPPRPHRYDSHPPDSERIARIEELATDGRTDGADAPVALTLLRDAELVFAALEARLLPEGAAQLTRMSWEDLVMARAVVDAEGWSRPLRVAVNRALRSSEEPRAPQASAQVADGEALVRQGGPTAQPNEADLPGLDEVLDAFDRGLLWMDIADRMPKPPQAARLTGPSARNFIRPEIFDGLAGMVHQHLVRNGHAVPDTGWSGQPGLTLPEQWEKGLDDALDAAVADTPDTTPLRSLLAGSERVSA
ncbi:M48 family metalloprotease [Streptomyces sp. NPDC005070]